MFVFEHGSEDRMKRSRLQWHYRTVLLVRIDWSRGLPGGTRLKSRELPTILTSARVCLYSERILCGHPPNEGRLNVHLPLAVHGANRRLSNQVSPCPVRLGQPILAAGPLGQRSGSLTGGLR